MTELSKKISGRAGTVVEIFGSHCDMVVKYDDGIREKSGGQQWKFLPEDVYNQRLADARTRHGRYFSTLQDSINYEAEKLSKSAVPSDDIPISMSGLDAKKRFDEMSPLREIDKKYVVYNIGDRVARVGSKQYKMLRTDPDYKYEDIGTIVDIKSYGEPIYLIKYPNSWSTSADRNIELVERAST